MTISAASATILNATIVDTTNLFSSGNLVLRATTGSTACDSSAAGVTTDAATCASSTLPTGPLTTSPTSATATLSSVGTLTPSLSRLTSNTCGVQQAATTTGADVALAYGDVTYASAGPLGATAVAFNSSGNFDTLNAVSGPSVFTQVAWFKTSSSGSIFSFANTYASSAPNSWDRMIWIDATGHVVAGVYPGAVKEIKSPSVYSDGAWHFVAVTLSASGATSGFRLYVDGTLVASSSSVVSAQGYTGYWHIGWSNAQNGWTDSPTSAFFTGSIAGVGVLPTALSAATIAALYASTDLSAYAATLKANAPTAYWPLDDTGANAYTGALPGVTSPCALDLVTVEAAQGGSVTCVAPAKAGACNPPSSAQTLGTTLNNALPNPTSSRPITLTTTMQVAAGLSVDATGLRLVVPVAYYSQLSSFNATLAYYQEVVIL